MKARRLWILVGALVLVAVVAGWLGTNWLAPQVIAQLESQLGQSLGTKVHLGRLQAIYPWRAVVGPVTIGMPGGPPLVSVPKVGVGFNLIGALAGAPQARLDLDRPLLALGRDRAGRLGLPTIGSSQGAAALARLLSGIDLNNASFTYDDRSLGGRAITLKGLMASVEIDAEEARYHFKAPLAGGETAGEGETNLSTFRTRAEVRVNGAEAATLASVLNLGALSVQGGRADANLHLDLESSRSPVRITGPVKLRSGSLALAFLKAPVDHLNVDGRVVWPQVFLDQIRGSLAGAAVLGTGRFDLPEQLKLDLNVAGPLERILPVVAQPRIKIRGPVRTTVQATIPLARPEQLIATGRFRGEQPIQVDQLLVEDLTSAWHYRGERFTAPFQLRIGGGNVTGTAVVQFAQGLLDVQARGRSLDPEGLAARYGTTIPLVDRSGTLDFAAEIAGSLARPLVTGTFAQSGGVLGGRSLTSTGRFNLLTDRLLLNGVHAQVAATGRVNADVELQLSGARPFSVRGNLQGVPLALASNRLGGFLSGPVSAQGTLESLQRSLVAEADLRSDRPLLDNRALPPLATALRFAEGIVQLDHFALGGLTASGTLEADLSAPPERLLRRADLAIAIDDFDLEYLPLPVRTRGRLDGQGTFTGNLQAAALDLSVRARGVGLGRYSAPALSGPVRWRNNQITATLTGQANRWNVRADLEPRGIRLTTLDIISGDATIAARNGFYDYERGPIRLDATVSHLDLDRLSLGPIGPVRSLQGIADARVQVRTSRAGRLEGRLEADLLQGRINELAIGDTSLDVRLQNGQVIVAPTVIAIEDSRYRLAGSIGLTNATPLALDVEASNGRLRHVVRLLGLSSLASLFSPIPLLRGRATDLGTISLGGNDTPLMELITVYTRANAATLARMNAMAPGLLPDDFSKLRGRFDLQARIGGTLANPSATFDLTGRRLAWQQYRLEAVMARGRYANQGIVIEDSLARYRDRTGTLKGRLGLNGPLDARLSIDRLPLSLVQRLLPESLALRGALSTDAQISGTLVDPVVTAGVEVASVQVNGQALDPVRTAVNLREGRVVLQATAVGIGKQGIRIEGSVPVPFLKPTDTQINIAVNFDGENLPLLNLLSDQLVWQPARGQVALLVRGTYAEPLIDGTVNLSNISAEVVRLNTSVRVDRVGARFNRRRLVLDEFVGSLGGAALSGSGALALRARNDTGESLTLKVGGTTNLPGLYRGGVEGEIEVGRAVLSPRIGGNIAVNNGDLLLSLQDLQTLSGAAGGEAGTLGVVSTIVPDVPVDSPIAFADLDVHVGPQFRVAVSTLEARLDGQITVNGPLNRLSLDGDILVPQGTLTIGAARFRIDTSRRNGLFFGGTLDPRLDLQASANVTDFRSTGIARLDSSELRGFTSGYEQTTLGRLERVEVRAGVTGTASKPEIDLTSSPSRTEPELFALIGGINSGSSLLSGLGSAVGGTLIRPVEQGLASALGLDEVRVDFGSQVASLGRDTFSIGIGIEAIKDLTPAVSLSFYRNLSDGLQPALFGIRYRISDQVVTRVDTNERLSETSLSVQYETRF